MGGGAWPFLVGGVICLVNSVNERDLCLLVISGSGFFTAVCLDSKSTCVMIDAGR